MSPNVNGFWALKGDRIDGLDVDIIRVEQLPGKTKLHRIARIGLCRAVVNGCLIWDLQINKLAPQREYQHQQDEQARSATNQLGDAFWNDVKHLTSRVDGLSFENRDSH